MFLSLTCTLYRILWRWSCWKEWCSTSPDPSFNYVRQLAVVTLCVCLSVCRKAFNSIKAQTSRATLQAGRWTGRPRMRRRTLPVRVLNDDKMSEEEDEETSTDNSEDVDESDPTDHSSGKTVRCALLLWCEQQLQICLMVLNNVTVLFFIRWAWWRPNTKNVSEQQIYQLRK